MLNRKTCWYEGAPVSERGHQIFIHLELQRNWRHSFHRINGNSSWFKLIDYIDFEVISWVNWNQLFAICFFYKRAYGISSKSQLICFNLIIKKSLKSFNYLQYIKKYTHLYNMSSSLALITFNQIKFDIKYLQI